MTQPEPNATNAPDAYDNIYRATWSRRSAGMLGGAILGVGVGAVIGVVAAFLPFVFGVIGLSAAVSLPGIALVAGSAALFAGIAGIMGTAAVAMASGEAAAVAAGLQEKSDRSGDGLDFSKGKTQAVDDPVPPLFSFKTGIITIPLFAAFGALLSLHPATASAVATLGFQGATATALPSAAAVAASATVFGMWGAVFGMPMSYLTNKAANLGESILNSGLFDSIVGKQGVSQPQINDTRNAYQEFKVEETISPKAKFTSEVEKRFTLHRMAEFIQKEKDVAQEAVITR